MTRVVDTIRKHPILLALPSAVIVVVTLAAVAGTKWYLTGDFAHTEFLVRAIPRHPPLIGVAARVRDDGSTPGPSMAYLLYPMYKAFGSNAFALVVAVDVLHVAAIAGCVVVAKRIGGVAIAAFVAGCLTVTVMAMTPVFFLQPWNVWVPVFAFALFLLLVWALACEHVALLPLAVAVGSHCVQTHISYTVLVTGLLGSVMAWLGWLWWRTDRLEGRHPLRWLLVSAGVMIVAWLPPVVDQLHPGIGNMRKLYHQFSDPGAPFVGTSAALKAMVGRFNLLGPWIAGAAKDPLTRPNYVGFVLFAALVAVSARWAWKRRDRVELALYAVLAVATVLGAISTMRIFGRFFEYVIRWMTPLVAMWIATCLWSCWFEWRTRSAETSTEHTERTWLAVAAAGLLAVTAVTAVTAVGVVRGAGADIPYARDSEMTGLLAGQLEGTLDPAIRYQINELDPVALGAVAYGLALEFEHHGVRAGIGPWGRSGVMPFRVVSDQQAGATLWYVASTPVIDAVSALPGAVVMAYVDVRTAAEVKRSDQLETEVSQALCDMGRPELRSLLFSRWGQTALDDLPELSSDANRLLRQYNDLRLPAAVVELPVGVNGYDITVPPLPACEP